MSEFRRILLATFLILGVLAASGCTTYHISKHSLMTQMESAVATEGTFVFPAGGLFMFKKVMSNGIRELVVIDNDGNEVRLRITQRTGIRIYKNDGKRKTFYFDTMFIYNDCVVGQNTHFFTSPIEPIPFESIVKIEIQ
jgi:hypothetical protein